MGAVCCKRASRAEPDTVTLVSAKVHPGPEVSDTSVPIVATTASVPAASASASATLASAPLASPALASPASVALDPAHTSALPLVCDRASAASFPAASAPAASAAPASAAPASAPAASAAPAAPSFASALASSLLESTTSAPAVTTETATALTKPAVFIVCVGNPGAGKSTLLNSMIGSAAFVSGLSDDGFGVTTALQTHTDHGITFIDTPGLVDPIRREQAAAEISKALTMKGKYKILFVITLESGFARPEDLVTIELVLEAVQHSSRDAQNNYGVIINKVVGSDLSKMDSQRLRMELFRDGVSGTDQIMWVSDNSDIEDKAGQVMHLSSEFQMFLAGVPWLDLSDGHVGVVNWNKFEQLRQDHEEKITELRKQNLELIYQIQQMEGTEVETKSAADAKALASSSHASDAMQPPAEDSIKRNKARELALRGIELGKVLDFYENLSRNRTPLKHFLPLQSTTTDVVRGAIIPSTAKEGKLGLSYAQFVHGEQGRLATRMVSHNWRNVFSHLVAAIVADALELPTFERVLRRLAPGSIGALRGDLEQRGKLDIVYWICAFSVNQHVSICKTIWPGDRDSINSQLPERCKCCTTLQPNSSPECEVDKFDEMMEFMLPQALLEGNVPRHVVALDQRCIIFSRAWVVAELVVAACIELATPLDQRFQAYNMSCLQDLERSTEGTGIDIRDCQASNPADVEFVLDKAAKLIDSSFEQFNKELNARIFRILDKMRKEIEKSEKLHVFCIGNAGVGKTTLLRAMTGSELVPEGRGHCELCEYEQDGVVFMEAPRLVDPQSRRDAAKAITQALKRDGRYALFFVMTLESGRVRAQDQEMMELVLKAAPIGENYMVVINKASEETMKKFSQRDALMKLSHALFAGLSNLKGCSLEHIMFVKKCAEIKLPPDLIANAPGIHIESGLVNKICGDTIEDVVNGLEANILELEEDNRALLSKLEQLAENKPVHPEKIFVIGGCQGGDARDHVQRLNINAEGAEWGVLDVGLSQARGLAGVAAVGSDMYTFGGTPNYYRRNALDTVEILTSRSEKWSTDAQNVKMPKARYMHRGAACNGKIYIVGGCLSATTTAIAEVDVFDLSTNKWQPGPPLPEPRCRFGMAVDDSCIYVVGGTRRHPADIYSDAVYILDTREDPLAWTAGPPCPTGREGLGAAAWNGMLYTAGGSKRGQETSAHFDIYDTKNGIWREGTPLPKSVEHVGVAATADSVYVIGGSGRGVYSGGPGFEVNIYSKDTEKWSEGPRLQRAVWSPSVVAV